MLRRPSLGLQSPIPIGIHLLPSPRVSAHVVNAELGLPSQRHHRQRRVGVTNRHIIWASVCHFIPNSLARGFLKSSNQIQNAVRLTRAEVVGGVVGFGLLGFRALPETFKAHCQVPLGEAAEGMTIPPDRSDSLTTIQRLLTDIRQYD
jgi:hypothetical protein